MYRRKNDLSQLALAPYMKERKEKIEQHLIQYINKLNAPKTLIESMNYSLDAGGKRLRPILVLATLSSFGKDEEIGLPVACAVEMIHTYSLIHDDLPCMDDDDFRRGKLTNHKVFGEAMAVLAGDGLQTYSFQILKDLLQYNVHPETIIDLTYELAKAAGPEGMVGGQVADMQGEGKQLTLEQLEYIHKNKTGRLLQFSIMSGAMLANATSEEVKKLREFSYHIGIAFQIRDDILDIEGEQEKIGKPVGSDTTNNKVTYPSLLTMKGAKDKLAEHIDKAKTILNELPLKENLLHDLCDLIASRDH
ncbi:polyprenyl synthetase family protein [Bacillus sp. FJAT-45066]|uniref:polyprenyl synthetase family protein n=1 Tax=Bacillus sp. FJAT-45066 TaxID=2011010 RepID=UPI000BB8DA37|nr:farnesyl diphosphate synthase [Bacillus sp. FJAT-45066]